jgi:hypothetical protein
MKYKIAEDARPQITLLIIATLITIALWFIPFADYLVYPIRLFIISATTDAHNDAMNMAQVTGLPAGVWILIWIGISILMISVGLRVYAVSRKGKQYDLPFEDK